MSGGGILAMAYLLAGVVSIVVYLQAQHAIWQAEDEDDEEPRP